VVASWLPSVGESEPFAGMSESSGGFLLSKLSHQRPGLPVIGVALYPASSGSRNATPARRA
jgi:hypothetical protein